jgi:hypothetical protein
VRGFFFILDFFKIRFFFFKMIFSTKIDNFENFEFFEIFYVHDDDDNYNSL